MVAADSYAAAAGLIALGAALGGCLDPTQVKLEIHTDAACVDLRGTGVWAGALGQIESGAVSAETYRCEDGTGRIGSLVSIPSGEDAAAVAFRVATSVGGSLEACREPPYGPSCIVARRALRYVPQTPLNLPIVLRVDCRGIPCHETETCVRGQCRPAEMPDPAACATGDGCGEDVVVAQDPPLLEPSWFRHFGGVGAVQGDDVVVSADGRIFVTGTAGGHVDFDGEPLDPQGNADAFVVSLLADGSVDGLQQLGGSGGTVTSPRLAAGSDSSVYLTGRYFQRIEYGNDSASEQGTGAGFVARVTPDGSGGWLEGFASALDHQPGGVAVDHRGIVRASGAFMGQLTFGGQGYPSVAASLDGFVVSYDDGPVPLAAMTLGGSGEDWARAVAVDSRANVYVAGELGAPADLGGGVLAHRGSADGFVASYTSEGGHRWSVSMGGGFVDQLWDVAVGPVGRVFVVGTFEERIDLGDGPVDALGARNGFVASYTAAGAFRWVQHVLGSGHVDLRSIATSPAGNVYVAGYFRGDAQVGGEQWSARAAWDMLVVSFAPDGTYRWGKAFAGDGIEWANGIAVTAAGEVVVAGHCNASVDIGSASYPCSPTRDVFVLKLGAP